MDESAGTDPREPHDPHDPQPIRRPAPSGYFGGRPTTSGPASASGPSLAPTDPAVAADEVGHAPVYGRVTRFGPPTPRVAAPTASPPDAVPPGGRPAADPWGSSRAAVHTSLDSPPAATGPLAAPSGNPATWAPPAPVPWGGPQTWPPPAPRPSWRPDAYASWLSRVAGDVVDRAPAYVASALVLLSYVPLYAGLLRGDLTARPTWWLLSVGLLLSLASTGWTVYNRWYVAGRTGQSLGRRLTRIWLVSAVDGRPIGMLNAFVRDLLHVVDGVAYVGYLWPLWDERRQTLADKLIDTVVVRTPVPPLTDLERSLRP